MRYIKIFSISVFVVCSSIFPGENYENILHKSDAAVFPVMASYDMRINVENDRGRKSQTVLTGYKKGSSKNVIVIHEPKKNAGTVEMRRDNSIWVYFSTNGKTMKSAFQSLAIGEDVCYGDILTNDLGYDYNVVSSRNDAKNIVLELKPKPGHEGYAKLVITLDGTTYLPVKKEYFALSGMLLKVCDVSGFEYGANGRIIKFSQIFYDPLKNKKSYIVVENIHALQESQVPEKYYNESYLKFMSRM
ncbi:MAG: outer membrane lipoprotein-sorting protein [Spirochaetes bacterium]|nr:outer membrane lipoprotein-sorting protein [Spirochaetota bacterium]